jgi:NADH-quinone oxidoreductase subunit M
MVLAGAFQASPVIAIIASAGLISSVIYALWFVFRIFQGSPAPVPRFADINPRNAFVCIVLAVGTVWIGLKPQPLIDFVKPAVDSIALAQQRIFNSNQAGNSEGANR